ncbi:terpene synthase family protein [Mesorhizobium retamae]|uniref:Terpene synthase n=1 Tax=Mesorhizobium retamae TaxID=2912854 RepID=A0ABS9QLW2_9HYPH|nr:terpene synthase family protein [Mesorhizobium sp. IRAMC:0171]MCG7508441.1 terpene synthase family protein [Mesorhizobium sp. IRAMC:0171]
MTQTQTIRSQPIKMAPDFNPFAREFPISPFKQEVEAKSVEFMKRYGLHGTEEQLRRLPYQECGGIAGNIYPMAPNAELLQIGADFSISAFCWDDEFCDEGHTRDKPMELADAAFRTMRCLEGFDVPMDENDRFALAWRDILQRISKHAPAYLMPRWIDSIRQWFLVEIQKACNVSRKIHPNVSDYMATRLHTGASPTYIHNILISNNLDLGADLLTDRRLCAMTEITAMNPVLTSDCYSYVKEKERTGDGYNMIDVLVREQNLTFEEAMNKTIDIRDNSLKRFIELKDEVLQADGNEKVALYIEALENYIMGANKWCQETNRYRIVEGTAMGRVAFVASGFTQDWKGPRLSEPSDVASIAWWWRIGKRATNSPKTQQ